MEKKRNPTIFYKSIKEVPTETSLNLKRVGIIPYYQNNFCFGIDKKTGDITDFGGSRKDGEGWLETALREFKEESNNIFNMTFPLTDEFCIIRNTTCVIFVDISFYKIPFKALLKKTRTVINDEISKCIWITSEELLEKDILTFYIKIRRILKVLIKNLNIK